ncbi:hypothetical protein INT47_011674 [Mucor saturninus]|uniref:Uncharacterized protein n=1 Tax=Mucor saturninus TaxID=64648 RepID=A0A8H7QJE3_9FUNG|nr:hypothetical protein INT47_011674 [Mucor saturninus]
MPQLNPTQKAYEVAKKNEGVTIAEITRKLNFIQAAMKRAIERYKKNRVHLRGKRHWQTYDLLPTETDEPLQYYVITHRRNTLAEIMANVAVNAKKNAFKKSFTAAT